MRFMFAKHPDIARRWADKYGTPKNLPEHHSKGSKMAKPPLGSGERFAALSSKLASQGAKNPHALAAYIGRKKYGKTRFQKLAAKGK